MMLEKLELLLVTLDAIRLCYFYRRDSSCFSMIYLGKAFVTCMNELMCVFYCVFDRSCADMCCCVLM